MGERGTSVVAALIEQADADLTTSALTTLELRSAINRLASTRQISQAAAEQAIQQCEAALASFTLLDLSAEVIARAQRLVTSNQLRTLDALQCATAILAQQAAAPDVAVVFVAADRKLLAAAQANGLDILNPEDADAVE